MSKRGKKINIKINLTNRWLYTLIAIGILAIIGVGVYATTDTSKGWHPSSQIEGLGSLATKNSVDLNDIQACANGKILQTSGGSWGCVDMPSLPTDCTIGQVLGWDGSTWDCADAGQPTSFDLVYSQHTGEQCEIFGELYFNEDDFFCKISSSECPVGWTQFDNWRATIPTTFPSNLDCNGCTTGSHNFANIAIESCAWESLYWTGACLSKTGYATVTEVGCY